MNILDSLLIVIIAASLFAGFRRGFILGTYEIVTAIIGLFVAVLAYDSAASLVGVFLPLRAAILNVIGFVLAYLVIQIPAALVLQPLFRLIRRATGFVPGMPVADRVAGVVPGFIQGILIAGVVVLGIGFFPTSTLPGEQLADSSVGIRLYREITGATLRGASAAGFEFSNFYALSPSAGDNSYVLPFEEHIDDLSVNTQDEARMLELINQERRTAGVVPLVLDSSLAAVARQHSTEMFTDGYFAHESPSHGSPFDRLDAAGIEYLAAGENLAFASNVERAHSGLMDSPGHRANILNPDYRRVGIGAISSSHHGTMYTQLFTN